MRHEDQKFDGSREIIDGNEYVNCEFQKCNLIFQGGDLPTINGCKMVDCTWSFDQAAMRTVQFMQAIYGGMGDGGKQLIEATFNTIREPSAAPSAN